MSDFKKRVLMAQNELKAPKGQYNSFGKYSYRSCEDILEAAKPICLKHNLMLNLSDDIVFVGDRYYIRAYATLYDIDSDETLVSTALARESETKKGMDDSQITGTASSYARKYALNGLFNIDDTKDADTDEYTAKITNKPIEYKCADCGKPFTAFEYNGKSYTAAQAYAMAARKSTDSKSRCKDCREKADT